MIPVTMNDRWTLLLAEHRQKQWEHEWEAARLDSMYANLRPGDLVYDIGAEEGDMGCLYASWGCDVVLCEPGPRVWANIKATFEANGLTGRVKACWVGFVGDEFRPETAAWGEQNGGVGGLWPRCADGPITDDHGFCVISERPDIPVATVDLLVAAVGVPQAITIDVEGAELRVLRGAKQTLIDHKPLVWASIHKDEAWMDLKFPGEGASKVHRFMAELGYVGTVLAEGHEDHFVFEHPDGRRLV